MMKYWIRHVFNDTQTIPTSQQVLDYFESWQDFARQKVS